MDAKIPFIGCPVWAHAPWVGRFFSADAKREDYLRQYSGVFNTAEGNATFYGIPKLDTVLRWKEDARAGFRFCFKFPRSVSHERQLIGAESEILEFFGRLEPLGERLGPFFLQLAPDFGADRLPVLDRFLGTLSSDFRYAVEVRHPDFFDGGEREARFEALLRRRNVDRVIFDTRGLFASAASDPSSLDAKRKKPRVPIRYSVTGRHPFVRFVGDPAVEKNDVALAQWAKRLAVWLADGKMPFFFVHHPDDVYAPFLGRRMQRFLHDLCPSSPAAPVWPVEAPSDQLEFL